MTYLAMQVLIEGLALAAFSLIRNNASDPLARAINAYVMQDEARHVMFGRLALRDFYPELTESERDEREEFCVDACYRMRDRFLGEEMWERLGLPVADVLDLVTHAELQLMFRGFLFTRIVPVLRDIGLWGPRIRGAFDDMGVLQFADADIEQLVAEDEAIAEDIDRQRLQSVHAIADTAEI
jgi:Long-chain fatty aldehyde decarbonylase